MEDAKLDAARTCWPAMAEQERDAAQRIENTLRGAASVESGAQAMADWIDARAAMTVYYDTLAHLKPIN